LFTVIKNDHTGREVWRYQGRIVERGATWVRLEAHFNRADMIRPYHTFRQGDRFIEWFYSDRWYNIFELHDVDDDHLTGWDCNVARPAALHEDDLSADDLALDVFVRPDGRITVLDEDEFAALPLDDVTRKAALHAFDQLRALIREKCPPFDAIRS